MNTMNEKFVKVEVLVDTANPEHMSALNSLFAVVAKGPETDPNSETTEKPAPSSPDNQPRRGRPRKEVKPETPKAETQDPEPSSESEQTETEAEAKTYTIEEVREKLKEKVAEHREEIKTKLTELGAPNVSNLDPAKYSEFVDFLESL